MKKILSLALGMTFMLGMVAFGQEPAPAPSTDAGAGKTAPKKEKKAKKHKKEKMDKMSGDSTTAPKQ